MAYECKERGLVDLADPLAGQAKLFADLSPGVVIKVNRKKKSVVAGRREALGRGRAT